MAFAVDIVAIGEAMVEFNQVRGGDGRTYLQGFGGDTSNALIAAARQGARCAYVTRVGDDDFGRLLLALWDRESIDTRHVGIDPQAPTGIYFVRHGERGHSFSYRRAGSAASRMQPAGVPVDLIRDAAVLHVSGISQAISASARDCIEHAIAIARAAAVRVSYDPNLRLSLWNVELAREVVQATIGQCDEFLPSLEDLRALSGLEQPNDIIAWSHDHGARSVVLKAGDRGAWVSDGGRCTAIPSHRVASVDATGAGDCFDGSYLARRVAGDDALTAARWACAAAALATTGYGAVDPLPTVPAIERLLHAGA
jgi:2-dehydro-3-deoxygluconokinase